MYTVEIVETAARDGHFTATGNGVMVTSTDPEHDFCHELTKAGLPDGPVTFCRNGTPTLTHSSIHAMGKRRIELGLTFPHSRPKRKTAFNLDGKCGAKIAGGQNDGQW